MAVFAVTTAKGPNWDYSRGIREQAEWDGHSDWADDLFDRDVIILGGPVGDNSGDEVGLLGVEAADEDAVRAIFAGDPWATHGILRVKEVRPWALWLDRR